MGKTRHSWNTRRSTKVGKTEEVKVTIHKENSFQSSTGTTLNKHMKQEVQEGCGRWCVWSADNNRWLTYYLVKLGFEIKNFQQYQTGAYACKWSTLKLQFLPLTKRWHGPVCMVIAVFANSSVILRLGLTAPLHNTNILIKSSAMVKLM